MIMKCSSHQSNLFQLYPQCKCLIPKYLMYCTGNARNRVHFHRQQLKCTFQYMYMNKTMLQVAALQRWAWIFFIWHSSPINLTHLRCAAFRYAASCTRYPGVARLGWVKSCSAYMAYSNFRLAVAGLCRHFFNRPGKMSYSCIQFLNAWK